MTGPTADFLTALAAEGSPAEPSALELGTGTGRIALPLSARGVLVHGIDLSQAMVARLRAKPGAERVTVTAGDFPTVAAGRSFRLVTSSATRSANLASQDDQIECFRNAAAHLEPGGHFVIEVGLPDLRRLPPGQAKYPPIWTTTASLAKSSWPCPNGSLWSGHRRGPAHHRQHRDPGTPRLASRLEGKFGEKAALAIAASAH